MKKSNLLYINDKDAWLTWGALLVEDSYDNLLLPVSPKSYVENNFRSQPGKKVLTRNPQPADRNINLVFDIICDSRKDYIQKMKSLVEEMYKGIFALKVVPLETAYKVYLPENCFLSLITGDGFRNGKLSVQVNEPDPTDRKEGDILPWVFKDGKWTKGFWVEGGRWGMDL